MKLFYSDHIQVPLPEGHRFPMDKYARLRKRVMASGQFRAEDVGIPPEATYEEIARVHDPDYIIRFINGKLTSQEIRRTGFPWSPALVARAKRSVGATIQACRFAMKDGVSANLAGGTHHAFKDHGEGYCLLNDAAIAARTMQKEALCNRVVVIDCDVHQGNGTASIFAGDSTVFTFSIHGKNNFPFHKEKSDLDIALKDGTGDRAYLKALEMGLLHTLEFPADLAIYLAGADPYKEDRMGRLSLSKKGLKERDRMVFRFCHSAGIPVAVTMAGGYSSSVSDTVDIHFGTITAARQAETEIPAFGKRTDEITVT
jgi:acetoin utilization deacetylase AcuC-like enzyme